MTESSFREQIDPIPENNYFHFVEAEKSLEPHAFSRAYINFVHPEDILNFTEKFDGYVFVDSKGQEYPAMVELAPYQKVPKFKENKRPDPKTGTIEDDDEYQKFLQVLEKEEEMSGPIITMDQQLEELEARTKEKGKQMVKISKINICFHEKVKWSPKWSNQFLLSLFFV